MKAIRTLDDMIVYLKNRGDRKRVAVVCGTDGHTQRAVEKAVEAGFAEAVYVNDPDPDVAARRAVELVRDGKADILMKGLINTDKLLRAVLNKETGILPKGKILTHIAVAEIPNYPKPLFFTDAAVIPYPTQEQRIEQVRVAAYACHALGIEEPKISLVHCSEKVSEKTFPFTAGYQEIINLAKEGRFGKCIVDGPLDVKCSCSVQNMWAKGIDSPINGEADALIFPDIEAGNSFYKTLTLFGRAETAGVLQGPMAPVVLPSRGDSVFSKYYSIALAAV
jgi:phosphate butyryltransferase